jgi:hypothetical protein|tara:strand:- start:3528 stop:4085 length:558 start_codon:yes stop_codon:yes gene_type:complete
VTRTLTAAVLTEIAKPAIVTKLLVEIHFATPVYLTNHTRAVTWGGNTYQPGGGLLRVEAVKESADVRAGGFNLTLTGVSATYRALFLAGDTTDRRVVVRRVFFDAADALIADPVVIADGNIAGYRIKEEAATSVVEVEVASHWADFDKVAGRRTTVHSQQLHFPNDTGFRWAADAVKDLLWGRTA